ncbi:phenylalanine-4-hydroxylase, henna [Thraustotheca clavata]|uniref:phenylalanine 4-monooxygenase n=1 Tax=Thraustotheca clavata TaxID=74557 RepID=A0A1V9Y6H4_9STRA|nr:phenylalanine-4-hydroxylase, henna [Thraustotheca clavata]
MFRSSLVKAARHVIRQPSRLSALQCLPRMAMTKTSTSTPLFVRSFASAQTVPSSHSPTNKPKTSLMLEVNDHPGSLQDVLKFFWKHDVNMSRIESRPTKGSSPDYSFFIDFDGRPGDESVDALLDDLKKHCKSMMILNEKKVPWFPRKIQDLDMSVAQTLDAGDELESDHPGFHDPVYRARRNQLTDIAFKFRQGQEIPHIDYTPDEVKTWGLVYERMQDLWAKYACDEFKYILPLLESNCGYAVDNVPQAQDISNFLKECTGFTLRPVTGLLSSRDFLNGLAFRVFFSTQYLRHHTKPYYTPEPDICHELMGHAPMFADPAFADFSHEIGLASLGASDEEIERLATCYWFSVEFGVCMQHGEKKAYGAGLLSSFGELEYSCSPTRPAGGTNDVPEYRPWDPFQACKQKYPITTYQPVYYVAESLHDAKERMRIFTEEMKKPFHARYNPLQQTISVDRCVSVDDKNQKQTK